MNISLSILNSKSDFLEWDNFVDQSRQGSIFVKSWWLNCVCDGNFKIYIIRDNEGIVCGFPMPTFNKLGFSYSVMPLFSQTLGPVFRDFSHVNEYHKISIENKVLGELIDYLPDFIYFKNNVHFTFTNVLPFIWKGFTTSVRYTYIIDLKDQVDLIYQKLSKSYKYEINRANKAGLKIYETEDIELFIDTVKKSLDNLVDINYSLVRKIDQICKEKKARKIYLVKNNDNQIHSALYAVYTKNYFYNLIQGGDPNLRKSGSNIYAMWHSIMDSKKYSLVYDFEGSMLQNIEPVFRRMGGKQVPYYTISKNIFSNSKSLITKRFKKLFY